MPTAYVGPTFTTLSLGGKGTYQNSTHWKWTFRCQNCTSWAGGTMDQTDTEVMGWAVSTVGVSTPSDPNTVIVEHTDCKRPSLASLLSFWSAHCMFLQSISGATIPATHTPPTTRLTSPSAPVLLRRLLLAAPEQPRRPRRKLQLPVAHLLSLLRRSITSSSALGLVGLSPLTGFRRLGRRFC